MSEGIPLKDSLRRRLEQCTSLPSLPAAAARVVELGRDPDASMKDVAEAVTSDPALAAKVLRMANSPLYARRRKCESFQQALVLLGLNATLTLALTFSLVTTLRSTSSKGLDYGRLWRRSLLAATAARVVAAHLGSRNTEDAFLCGLLQDIGLLALDTAYPELYRDLSDTEQTHDEIIAVERAKLGCDHAKVGAWLLARWKINEQLCQVVETSHGAGNWESSASINALPLVHAVALSGPIADLWMSSSPESSVETFQFAASQIRDFDGGTMSDLVEQVAEAVPEIEQMFDMKVVDPERSEWILNDAREVLSLRNLQMIEESNRLQQISATLQAQAKALEEKSRKDDLTGTYNRGHLDQVLSEWFTDSNKSSIPLSLVFIDLDNFKQINDRHGHQLGDDVLVSAASALKDLARASDLVARYGGEEFVMLLPGCNADGAKKYCQRLLQAFRSLEHPGQNGERISVRASMGVATHGESFRFDSCEELLRSADRALYQAKQSGKDRFVEYGVTSNAA